MKTWATSTFDKLAGMLKAKPGLTWSEIQAIASDSSPATAVHGIALALAWTYSKGDHAGLPAILESAASHLGVLPPPLFALLLAARHLNDDTARIPSDFLEYGYAAVDKHQYDLGAEAIGAAFVEDADAALTLIYQTDTLRRATLCYEQVAAANNPGLAHVHRQPDAKIRVGMIVANLVDDVVAYSKRVVDFARHIDTERFQLYVYSSENLCMRTRQLPARCMARPSAESAPKIMAVLKERGVPLYLASRNTLPIATAQALASRIASDNIDILIVQSGPAMPIDWLACRWAPAPVKLHIHIGAPLYQQGISATFFDNTVNLERERVTWPAYAGRQVLLRQGTDLGIIDAQPAANRADFGIPPNVVLIGVLSNHLDKRLSPAYLDLIKSVLADEPKTDFVAIGGRDLPGHAAAYFKAAGLIHRVHHIPSQRQAGSTLKLLDIYASEFPVGGSQSVVEAMVCGLPVVAMRHGDTHVECAASDIVGPPIAIESNDPGAYRNLLMHWIRDPAARRAAGRDLRRRAEAHFSIHDYVRRVCAFGAEQLAGHGVSPQSD